MRSVRTFASSCRASFLLVVAPVAIAFCMSPASQQQVTANRQLYSIMLIDIAPGRAADGA